MSDSLPEHEADCRTVPGRLTCRTQLIHTGCHLLPTSRSVDLLERAEFREVGTFDVKGVHVVGHGTK